MLPDFMMRQGMMPSPAFQQNAPQSELEPDYFAEMQGQQEQSPNDFWARMSQGGAQPFQYDPGPKPTGLEVLLAALAGFANAKTKQGARRVDETQQRNTRARDAAKTLATWRHDERKAARAKLDAKEVLGENRAYQERLRNTPLSPVQKQNIKDEAAMRREGAPLASADPSVVDRRHGQLVNTILDNARQDPDISQFVTIRDAYGTGNEAANQGDSAGDLILMRMVAKATDPTTGVLQQEFETFKSAQGALAKLGVRLTTDMVGEGSLTPVGRERLRDALQGIYDRKRKRHKQAKSFYERQAKSAGLDPKDVIRDYDDDDDVAPGSGGGGATTTRKPAPGSAPVDDAKVDAVWQKMLARRAAGGR
jgi:hypothetical protein